MFTPAQHADFNAWANERLHGACAQLDEERLRADVGAFFRSILGTLNHILLVDLLYMDRLHGRTSPFKGLDEPVCASFAELRVRQAEQDRRFIDYVASLSAHALQGQVRFRTLLSKPKIWTVPMSLYLANLFQHQAHHRAHVHNMLSQQGVEPPPIGFVEFAIEAGLVAPPEDVPQAH